MGQRVHFKRAATSDEREIKVLQIQQKVENDKELRKPLVVNGMEINPHFAELYYHYKELSDKRNKQIKK